MLNQWIGIRFDLVPDRNKDVTLKNKSRDQLSQLDIEYFNINNNQKTLN